MKFKIGDIVFFNNYGITYYCRITKIEKNRPYNRLWGKWSVNLKKVKNNSLEQEYVAAMYEHKVTLLNISLKNMLGEK